MCVGGGGGAAPKKRNEDKISRSNQTNRYTLYFHTHTYTHPCTANSNIHGSIYICRSVALYTLHRQGLLCDGLISGPPGANECGTLSGKGTPSRSLTSSRGPAYLLSHHVANHPQASSQTTSDIYIATATAPASPIVQELCESRGGRPGLSILTSLLVSVDVKLY